MTKYAKNAIGGVLGYCEYCEWDIIDPLRYETFEYLNYKENSMDFEAQRIVDNYVIEHLDKTDEMPFFETYIVWKCKVLQNWKYLISTNLLDGMYYELTFNGDKNEWYLDAYKKFENRVIPKDEVH